MPEGVEDRLAGGGGAGTGRYSRLEDSVSDAGGEEILPLTKSKNVFAQQMMELCRAPRVEARKTPPFVALKLLVSHMKLLIYGTYHS